MELESGQNITGENRANARTKAMTEKSGKVLGNSHQQGLHHLQSSHPTALVTKTLVYSLAPTAIAATVPVTAPNVMDWVWIKGTEKLEGNNLLGEESAMINCGWQERATGEVRRINLEGHCNS